MQDLADDTVKVGPRHILLKLQIFLSLQLLHLLSNFKLVLQISVLHYDHVEIYCKLFLVANFTFCTYLALDSICCKF